MSSVVTVGMSLINYNNSDTKYYYIYYYRNGMIMKIIALDDFREKFVTIEFTNVIQPFATEVKNQQNK
jgi:hypothetical protein